LSYISTVGSRAEEVRLDNGLIDEDAIPSAAHCSSNDQTITRLTLKPSIAQSGVITFRKLSILSSSRLLVDVAGQSLIKLKINQLAGDSLGQIIIPSNQTFEVESDVGAKHDYILPCAFQVQEGATLIVPSRLRIAHSTSTLCGAKYDLELRGKLSGVRFLTVGGKAQTFFGSTSSVVLFADDTSSDKLHFSFSSLTLLSNSSMTLGSEIKDRKMVIPSKTQLELLESLDLRYGSTILSSDLQVTAPNITISYGGRISTDGFGNKAGEGDGSYIPSSTKSLIRGASHAGCGGVSSLKGSDDITSCKVYGELKNPSYLGSGGEVYNPSSAGVCLNTDSIDECERKIKLGFGGGKISISVAYLRMDGVISSNGEAGYVHGDSQVKIGGGSGGSVLITISDTLRGTGTFESVGGHGIVDTSTGSGVGGGSGGRLSIVVSTTSLFTGTYSVQGGGLSATDHISGGAGTAYVEDRRSNSAGGKVPFKVLIIDNYPVEASDNGDQIC